MPYTELTDIEIERRIMSMNDFSAKRIRELVCEGVHIVPDEPKNGFRRYQIRLPYYFDGGTGIHVVIEDSPDGWRLTDDGYTFSDIMVYGRAAAPSDMTLRKAIRCIEDFDRIRFVPDPASESKKVEWGTFVRYIEESSEADWFTFEVFRFFHALYHFSQRCAPNLNRLSRKKPASHAAKAAAAH